MYHIGVGFEVVRFDMMGLPGPQFVKRATGKFTLSFYCVVNRLFHIKSTIMVRPKLSFDVKADKVKAIADYVRTHVSSISFLGKAKGLKVKSAILEPGTIQLPSETDSHWNVSGHVKLGIEKEDGILENNFFFTCDCELSKGDEGEPIVTGLTKIQVGERI